MGVTLHFELCHIRNIEGGNLIPRDEVLLIFMKIENMDACWGTEPSTLGGELGIIEKN